MGAADQRIEINGNAKYDLLLDEADTSFTADMKNLFNLKGDEPVFVAGSTRTSEEEIVLDVYQKIIQSHPHALLIIAPRHVERAGHIKNMVAARGFACQFRTELDPEHRVRTAPVVIMDTIGDLQRTYSIASVVFCQR